MKFNLAVALTGLAALLAAQTLQPLNARTGEWKITETVHYSNVPAQWASMMPNNHVVKYTSCVRAEDLKSNPWSNPGSHCQWTVVKSTGSDMELQGSGCQLDARLGDTGSVHGTIHLQDSQNGTGSMDFSAQMQGLVISGHADYTGTWAGAACTNDN